MSNGDIAHSGNMIHRIDNMATFQQKVIATLAESRKGDQKKNDFEFMHQTCFLSKGQTCSAVSPQIQRLSSAVRKAMRFRAMSIACSYVQYFSTSGQSVPAIKRFGPKPSYRRLICRWESR